MLYSCRLCMANQTDTSTDSNIPSEEDDGELDPRVQVSVDFHRIFFISFRQSRLNSID